MRKHGVALVLAWLACGPPPSLGGRVEDASAGAAGSAGWRRWRALGGGGGIEDLQPVPPRGACRLGFYDAAPPSFTDAAVRCNGSSACPAPCAPGFAQLAGALCVQQCPRAGMGPPQLCAPSRTCVRGGALCPSAADEVRFACPAPDGVLGARRGAARPRRNVVRAATAPASQQLTPTARPPPARACRPGACAKQSYQAVQGRAQPGAPPCGGTLVKGYDGGWRCADAEDEAAQPPCAPGFTNSSPFQPGIGARCVQVCPPWLVDCGGACHMPAMPCSRVAEVLCPVPPPDACSLAQRSSAALAAACEREGFGAPGGGAAGCPLTLSMHGGCGGARLEVRSSLRQGGVLRGVEAWWERPAAAGAAAPGPDPSGGPLLALRLTFTSDGDAPTTVLGNASHVLASPPSAAFRLGAGELVVALNLWSSTAAMDGAALTPLLGGFSLFTSRRAAWAVGGAPEPPGAARLALSGAALGVGLPVGVAAWVSEGGVHALGLIFLTHAAGKQEL
ncbi:hypothetical protein HT031_001911 [Scenedesmus sp. PABB004]|nr:hypothetical protein HT031_001911 [Scenedesmus sp. PABB004]